MTTSYEDIQFTLQDGIARLTLNRPDKLNCFTARMHGEVASALDQVESASARVLLITGAGRGFCAGQDLSERRPAPGAPQVDLGETVEKYYAPLVRRLHALPLPVVVGVNGVAAGAGANLALAGDIVIAKESASFIEVFCRLGLIPDTGGTYVLPRLVGRARAMGMAMLGERIDARQAEQWGLIWQCVADDAFDATLETLCRHFAAAPTKGLAYTKRALLASMDHTLDEQLALEVQMMRELGRSQDYAEGVAAFLEKREPRFQGR
ncbi:2-(1,2-epoxy-1,2-dihydrophenyl)acetyl-CoA isomerase PaaG [Bordetella genomosp. 11]|uniref:2-(1,2-epoxy-1,2-dihydrophenyl)acetyl-CoA isomerase n=1 Tax=Bordetella genomosp. 11 TaxID=1416808 RepID=A0A261UHS8_9BORD|nr:2-(1,2-epoxy-1,2-dihydrophenyl)acetyl-CoA isomerase PaaG [Bordetella genomosp. 11]OZI61498.1 2-(1,2-epoxy-1,2-dihydrophenyl)acetyl-CoA isomerase [Bordetella genomosp. 11]